MSWIEIEVKTERDALEEISGVLTGAGFAELVIEDGDGFSAFLEENRAYWDYIDEELEQRLQDMSSIKLYVENDDKKSLRKLRALLKDRRGVCAVTEMLLPETDWEESWKDSYPPQVVGENLIVLPYWRAEDTQGRNPIILDPGLTFGTGAHETTQMVLEEMEKRIKPGDSCLDLGSGSGILSIAALRLGAKEATGVDIDPKAEDVARENLSYNGIEGKRFTALTGDVTSNSRLMATLKEKRYDVVLVNIVADVIVALSPVLPEFLDDRSILILSGILDSRLEDVLRAVEKAGLVVESVRQKENWRCVCAKRRTL